MKLKKFIGVTTLLMGAIFSNTYSQHRPNPCPILSNQDLENTINNGSIQTIHGYTLANRTVKTRAQVLLDEPTANPFDTYYDMQGLKEIDDQAFLISIDGVLGKDVHEAKERAKQILLSNGETNFEGTFDKRLKECIYKQIQAAQDIPHFPFKTKTELVEINARLVEY